MNVPQNSRTRVRLSAYSASSVGGRSGIQELEGSMAFAHPSEGEFARFLDFHQVHWRYESICFPIEWDESGKVVEAFTPDFYLPEFDIFVELTTMKQRLVTKKNRKIRRMRELYPEIRIKILYRRDYRKLLFKFGEIA